MEEGALMTELTANNLHGLIEEWIDDFDHPRIRAALDYSLASLWIPDGWLHNMTFLSERRQGWLERPTVDVMISAAGAYAGEVVRRRRGGTWADTDGLPELRIDDVRFGRRQVRIIDKAHKQVRSQEDDSLIALAMSCLTPEEVDEIARAPRP